MSCLALSVLSAVQRIAVCDESAKKPLMAWYDALLRMCNAFST
jgi:hypothetical protein